MKFLNTTKKIIPLLLLLVCVNPLQGAQSKDSLEKPLSSTPDLVQMVDELLTSIENSQGNGKIITKIYVDEETGMQCVHQKTLDNTCNLCCIYNVLLRAVQLGIPLKYPIPECPELLMKHASAFTIYHRSTVKYFPTLDYKEWLSKDTQGNIEMKIAGLEYDLVDRWNEEFKKNVAQIKKTEKNEVSEKYLELTSAFHNKIKEGMLKVLLGAPTSVQFEVCQDIVDTGGGISMYNDAEGILQNFGIKAKCFRSNDDLNETISDKSCFAFIGSSGGHAVTFLRIMEAKDAWKKQNGYSKARSTPPTPLKEVAEEYGKKQALVCSASGKVNPTSFIILARLLYSLCKTTSKK